MSILFRSAPRASESRDISYQKMFGSGRDLETSGGYSAREALCLSAVASCAELRANWLAQMPFDSYREGPGGTSLKVSPQPKVIARPSARGIPRSLVLKQAQYARVLWGNATLIVGSRDGAGYPTSLDVLPPWDVTFEKTSVMERLEVRIGGQPFPVDDLVIVPGQVQPGHVVGVAPLAASGLVDLGKRAQEYGRSWFAGGAIPSSILYSDQPLTSEQADTIVTTVLSKWRNRKPAVLGSGLKYEQISVAANESQFLDTIRQNMAEIAIVLGVPPDMIGVAPSGSSVTYANREQNAQQVMVNTVNSDVLLWQEVLYDVVPKPQFVRFGTGALLRTDLSTRYRSYAQGITAGFLEVNEARALEDLPPITPPAPAEPRQARTVAPDFEERELITKASVGHATHIHLPDSLDVQMRQEAPVVNVPAPIVNVTVEPTPVTVEVAAPVVNVEPTPVTVEVAAPVVHVELPSEDDSSVEMIRFERDADGRIVGAVKGSA